MMRLAMRLFSGSDKEGRYNITLPVLAVAVSTTLLLLTVGAWMGFEARADRTTWMEPAVDWTDDNFQVVTDDHIAVQTVESEWVEGAGELTTIHFAPLTDDVPAPPGLDAFPAPGEVWVSGALADQLHTAEGDAVAAQLGAEPGGLIDQEALAHPDQLVAVAGHDDTSRYADPGAADGPGAMFPPMPISAFSDETTDQAGFYQVLAGTGVVLMVVPLLALGGSASRLVAARRRQRLSQLRLIGGSVRQVLGLAVTEAAVTAAIGAVAGAVLYALLLPFAAMIPIAGGSWYVDDIWVGPGILAAVVAGIVLLVAGSGVTAMAVGIRDPLGMARSSKPRTVRLWRLGALALAVGGFLMFGTGSYRMIAVTIGLVMVAFSITGPWLVKITGLVMARFSRSPTQLIAGRRLAEDPRAGWRSVAGMVLGGFTAGFVAMIPAEAFNTDPTGAQVTTDIRIGVTVVLISAFTVAAVSAGAGGIARVLDQRGPLTLLRLAGAPVRMLARSRRREVFAPILLFGGGSALFGAVLGALAFLSVGVPTGTGIALFAGLTAAGMVAVLLADATSRGVLNRVTADIAVRE